MAHLAALIASQWQTAGRRCGCCMAVRCLLLRCLNAYATQTDTDSVMIHFPGCSLQQTAHHGQRLSTFFDTQMLKAPHTLAFEKILFPTAFYKVRSCRVRVRVL